MTQIYKNPLEIIQKYDKLYEPVFFPNYLLHIFNDEHDHDVDENAMNDTKIMLTMGHYHLLEQNDISMAKKYYEKVTKLNNSMGDYTMAVYYYTMKEFQKSMLYANIGYEIAKKNITINSQYLSDFAILFHKLSLCELKLKYDKAEEYLTNELEILEAIEAVEAIKQVEKTKIKIIETLCLFYLHNHLNVKNSYDKLIKLTEKYSNIHDNLIKIIAQYYCEIADTKQLLKFTQLIILKGDILGNYYMGMLNYLKFINICAKGKANNDNVELMIELLTNAEMWFQTVVTNQLANKKKSRLINYSNEQIKKIIKYKEEIIKITQKQTLV